MSQSNTVTVSKYLLF